MRIGRFRLSPVLILLLLASVALGLLQTRQGTAVDPSGAAVGSESTWVVGQLRDDGLRIEPSGRRDASAVLDPEQFADPEVRNAYRIATEIPEVLNDLYCWCGCENRGVHRSNLGCFEDEMGVDCEVCRGTAEIAWRLVQEGVTDTARIQAAVDAVWAPRSV